MNLHICEYCFQSHNECLNSNFSLEESLLEILYKMSNYHLFRGYMCAQIFHLLSSNSSFHGFLHHHNVLPSTKEWFLVILVTWFFIIMLICMFHSNLLQMNLFVNFTHKSNTFNFKILSQCFVFSTLRFLFLVFPMSTGFFFY